MPKQGKYPDELRERVVRLVLDHQHEYGSQWEAICSIADHHVGGGRYAIPLPEGLHNPFGPNSGAIPWGACMRIIEDLYELSRLLEEEFGSSEDLAEISLPVIDGDAVVKALQVLLSPFRLPDDYAKIIGAFQLAGRDLGISFGWGDRPADYVEWIGNFSRSLDDGQIVVASNDPYFVVMDLASGRLFGHVNGTPVETPIDLNINFRQLIVGAANLSLGRTFDERTELRRILVEQWASPPEFWDSV